jgi:tRNA (guanine37-N1)-methyltransferase
MLEVSIGDYVLFGGEIPAMAIIDSCLRFLPGIMTNETSTEDESFTVDLLEYPQYTKPVIWNGNEVPSVLLSGNHKEIALWRTEQSKQVTQDVRPDLWQKYLKNRE